jgi:hypothetical protein
VHMERLLTPPCSQAADSERAVEGAAFAPIDVSSQIF